MMIGCHPLKMKGPLVLLLVILATSIFYVLIASDHVQSSENRLRSPGFLISISEPIKSKLVDSFRSLSSSSSADANQDNVDQDNIDEDNDDDDKRSLLESYLTSLGLAANQNSPLWNETSATNHESPGHEPLTNPGHELPPFVTCVTSDKIVFVPRFVSNFKDNFPDNHLTIHAIQLDDDDLNSLNKSCNVSSSCNVEIFNFDNWPNHLSDLKLNAYRPLIIQSVLNKSRAIIWLEIDLEIKSGISSIISQTADSLSVSKSGIFALTTDYPTSSITHPKMYEFFSTFESDYYFQRSISLDLIIIYNTNLAHYNVMTPWVKCALISDCISPLGAQSSGCRFDKKPLYRYSGCHFYDISALNLILGLSFDHKVDEYTNNPPGGQNLKLFVHKITKSDLANLEAPSSSSSSSSQSDYDLNSLSSDQDQDKKKDKISSLNGTSSHAPYSSTPKLSFNKSGWRIRH